MTTWKMKAMRLFDCIRNHFKRVPQVTELGRILADQLACAENWTVAELSHDELDEYPYLASGYSLCHKHKAVRVTVLVLWSSKIHLLYEECFSDAEQRWLGEKARVLIEAYRIQKEADNANAKKAAQARRYQELQDAMSR